MSFPYPITTLDEPIAKWYTESCIVIRYLRRMKMLSRLLCCLFLFSGYSVQAQEVQGISTKQANPINFESASAPKGFSLHVDYSFAVIDNRYEILRDYKSGMGVGLVYKTGQWFSVSGVFTKYVRHDAFALRDCQAWSFDVDGQLTMRMGQSNLYFRMLYGVGYTDWKGYYVGPNLNDNYHYYKGKLLKDQYYTGNIGWGFSHFFIKQRMEGFSDFRLEFAADPRVAFSIRDTQFHIGVRYHIGRTEPKNEKDGNANRKTNREKNRRVYKWMKERN